MPLIAAGCTPIAQCNWYSWLKQSLEKEGVEVSMQDMPDPYEAKQTIWLPFMRDVLKAGLQLFVGIGVREFLRQAVHVQTKCQSLSVLSLIHI